jgi:hypothetical protein
VTLDSLLSGSSTFLPRLETRWSQKLKWWSHIVGVCLLGADTFPDNCNSDMVILLSSTHISWFDIYAFVQLQHWSSCTGVDCRLGDLSQSWRHPDLHRLGSGFASNMPWSTCLNWPVGGSALPDPEKLSTRSINFLLMLTGSVTNFQKTQIKIWSSEVLERGGKQPRNTVSMNNQISLLYHSTWY